MVSFNNVGRLGNWLFECSAALAYALDHGLEFTVPSTTKDALNHPIYFPHLVNPKWDATLPTITLTEKQFSYDPLPFEENWRAGNIVLDGYWQSEKYWKHHRDRILEAFRIPWNSIAHAVGVHVRRGDYLIHTHKHPPVTLEWYQHAMSRFQDGMDFVFFSDDIPYCKKHFGKNPRCLFSENKTELDDLSTLSSFQYQILSASTFSLWGYFLNRHPDKRAIMPRDWFVPNWNGLDTKDVVPPEIERL